MLGILAPFIQDATCVLIIVHGANLFLNKMGNVLKRYPDFGEIHSDGWMPVSLINPAGLIST